MGWNGCEPFPEQITVTRDDLIRLVVGMQWVEAMRGHHVTVGEIFDGTYFAGSFHPNVAGTFDLRPAVDIVDEWLGVR